jgi:hypothetical protein
VDPEAQVRPKDATLSLHPYALTWMMLRDHGQCIFNGTVVTGRDAIREVCYVDALGAKFGKLCAG